MEQNQEKKKAEICDELYQESAMCLSQNVAYDTVNTMK